MDSDPSVLQLRTSLRDVSPPVWRRVLIPEQITIALLHQVIQLAMGWDGEHLHRFIIRGWRYGGRRDGAFQFFDEPDALSLAAFDLHDFNSWWLHDVRVERRTSCNHRSRRLPCCVAGSGRCPPDDAGGPERYMNALEVHGEHEFLEWIQTLREVQIDLNDLRVEVDEWLIWLARGFDRRAANELLQTLAR
jgi:hypothetical protein